MNTMKTLTNQAPAIFLSTTTKGRKKKEEDEGGKKIQSEVRKKKTKLYKSSWHKFRAWTFTLPIYTYLFLCEWNKVLFYSLETGSAVNRGTKKRKIHIHTIPGAEKHQAKIYNFKSNQINEKLCLFVWEIDYYVHILGFVNPPLFPFCRFFSLFFFGLVFLLFFHSQIGNLYFICR